MVRLHGEARTEWVWRPIPPSGLLRRTAEPDSIHCAAGHAVPRPRPANCPMSSLNPWHQVTDPRPADHSGLNLWPREGHVQSHNVPYSSIDPSRMGWLPSVLPMVTVWQPVCSKLLETINWAIYQKAAPPANRARNSSDRALPAQRRGSLSQFSLLLSAQI